MFPNLYNAAYQNQNRVGTAVASDVLSGKTFSNSTGSGLTGTMVNRGTLNWNPTSNTTQTVQPGYYSGGTLNSKGAYDKGISDADARVNTNSESYKKGLENGSSNVLVDIKSKYGTLNNSFFSATPISVAGYNTVLFGFQTLTHSGPNHEANISASNISVSAGSIYGNYISVTTCQYLLKPGIPYIIKEYDLSNLVYHENKAFDVEGYRLVGAVVHASNYSSTNMSTLTETLSTITDLNTQSVECHNGFPDNATMKATAKFLYIPDNI